MKKTLITARLATGLLFVSIIGTGTDTSACSVHYKDVKTSDNFYPAVESLIDQKAINRTNDKFRPYENVTRGQASSIIAKLLELNIENVKDPNFKDVPTRSKGNFEFSYNDGTPEK